MADDTEKKDGIDGVSRNELDQLLMGISEEETAEPENDRDPAAEPSEKPVKQKETNTIPHNQIDRLLMGASFEESTESGESDPVEASGNEVESAASQEQPVWEKEPEVVTRSNIGKRLQKPVEEGISASGDNTPATVPHEEINRLLQDALEDTDGNMDGEKNDEPVIVTQADIDKLLRDAEDNDETPEEEDSARKDKVILKAATEEETVPFKKTEASEKEAPWYASKVFLVCSSILVAISFTAISLVMYSRTKSTAPKTSLAGTTTFSIERIVAPEASVALTIVFKNFIIPAPLEKKNIAYIIADISINMANSVSAKKIKKNEPFFRNLIYDVLINALISQGKDKISPGDIKITISEILNNSLPEDSINTIDIVKFEAV